MPRIPRAEYTRKIRYSHARTSEFMEVEGGYIVFSTGWKNFLSSHPASDVACWGKLVHLSGKKMDFEWDGPDSKF